MTGRASPTIGRLPPATAVSYAVNRASTAEIAAHLKRCDAHFIPPLSSRVDLDVYAAKIERQAERFEAWAAGGLVGLIAAYANDPARQAAFVTSVSVIAERRGERIASRLMENCIHGVRRAGFERMSLRVDRDQTAVIRLYERCGFSRVPERPPERAGGSPSQGEAAPADGFASGGGSTPTDGSAPGGGSDIIMTLELTEAVGRHARL